MLSISRPLQSILILIFTELLFNIKGKIRFPRQPKPQVPTEYPQDVWVAFQSQSLKSGNAIYYVLKLWSGICQLILMEDLCCSELWTSERQSQSFLFLSQEQCIQTSQLSAFVTASSLIFLVWCVRALAKKMLLHARCQKCQSMLSHMKALVYNVLKLNRSCIEIPRGIPFVSKWRWMILKFIKASSWINGSIKPIVSLCLCHTSFACAKKWHKVLWPEPFSYLSIDSGANSNLHSLSSPINTLSSWILPSHSSGQKI